MMLILGFLAGFAYGWWRTARLGAPTRDRLHRGVVFGFFGVIVVFGLSIVTSILAVSVGGGAQGG